VKQKPPSTVDGIRVVINMLAFFITPVPILALLVTAMLNVLHIDIIMGRSIWLAHQYIVCTCLTYE
jgi:hypothetical protein